MLPDDMPIERFKLHTRLRNALTKAGIRTVGQLCELSDVELFGLPDVSVISFRHLRRTFGPSKHVQKSSR